MPNVLSDYSVAPETDPILWGSKCSRLDSSLAWSRGVYTTEKFVSQNIAVYQDAIINCAETQILISTVLKWIERMISWTYRTCCLQSGRMSSSAWGTAPLHPLQNPLIPGWGQQSRFPHRAIAASITSGHFMTCIDQPHTCTEIHFSVAVSPFIFQDGSQERTEGGYRYILSSQKLEGHYKWLLILLSCFIRCILTEFCELYPPKKNFLCVK